MWIPFLLFRVLLLVAREELGVKGIAVAVAIRLALLAGCFVAGISPHISVAAQALLDIVLILKIFGGDIDIR